MGVANFGIAGMDWQQRVNWDRLREYRIERARKMMKKHGLGAVLCMYDENVRYSFAWIKAAAGSASPQQVTNFAIAVIQSMKDNGVAGQKLGCDFIDINMIQVFKEHNINWVDGMTPMMEARAVKNLDEQECFRIVGAICDATHWECMKFLRPGVTENQVTAHLMK